MQRALGSDHTDRLTRPRSLLLLCSFVRLILLTIRVRVWPKAGVTLNGLFGDERYISLISEKASWAVAENSVRVVY